MPLSNLLLMDVRLKEALREFGVNRFKVQRAGQGSVFLVCAVREECWVSLKSIRCKDECLNYDLFSIQWPNYYI